MISKLSGHYIVYGFGRVGRGIAGELLREGYSACVVEIDAENCQSAEAIGLPIVRGDDDLHFMPGRDVEVLKATSLSPSAPRAIWTNSPAPNRRRQIEPARDG